MKNALSDYVFTHKDVISSEICDDTIKSLESCNFLRHMFVDYDLEQSPSDIDSEVYSPNTDDECMFAIDVYNKLMEKIEKSIKKYFDNFNFSWYNGWNGFTPIKFNKYTKNTGMKIHCDHIHSIFDGKIKGIPTLTVIGLLNNDFIGGEFILFDDKEYILDKGDVIIFPSNFLFPHSVKTIKNGVRYSFVSWVF